MPSGQPREKLECPNCGCGHCSVFMTQIYETTFRSVTRKSVRRHRKCRYCGWTFITIETHEDPDNAGVPAPLTKPIRGQVHGAKVGRPAKISTKIAAKPVQTSPTKKPRPPKNPYL